MRKVTEPIRVLLIDDDSTVRRGLKRVVNDGPQLTFVGEAGTSAGAERVARDLRPDITPFFVLAHDD